MEDLRKRLTGRTFNCLKNAGFKSAEEVIKKYKEEGETYFLKIKDFNRRCFAEIKEYIEEKKEIEQATKILIKAINEMKAEKEINEEMIGMFTHGVIMTLKMQGKDRDVEALKKSLTK